MSRRQCPPNYRHSAPEIDTGAFTEPYGSITALAATPTPYELVSRSRGLSARSCAGDQFRRDGRFHASLARPSPALHAWLRTGRRPLRRPPARPGPRLHTRSPVAPSAMRQSVVGATTIWSSNLLHTSGWTARGTPGGSRGGSQRHRRVGAQKARSNYATHPARPGERSGLMHVSASVHALAAGATRAGLRDTAYG
jgi:hypothetical protein